jgi:hypothetical protein
LKSVEIDEVQLLLSPSLDYVVKTAKLSPAWRSRFSSPVEATEETTSRTEEEVDPSVTEEDTKTEATKAETDLPAETSETDPEDASTAAKMDT